MNKFLFPLSVIGDILTPDVPNNGTNISWYIIVIALLIIIILTIIIIIKKKKTDK